MWCGQKAFLVFTKEEDSVGKTGTGLLPPFFPAACKFSKIVSMDGMGDSFFLFFSRGSRSLHARMWMDGWDGLDAKVGWGNGDAMQDAMQDAGCLPVHTYVQYNL